MKNLYDPAAALEFFKAGGKVQKIPQGETIFSERKKAPLLRRERMYLLVALVNLKPELGLSLLSSLANRLRRLTAKLNT
ncbi:MAG TPA: hypothetical protein VD965_00285 [Burkholderiales bacterium]|nr:hypothetical protein [Burkholderiales bacterium]